MGKREENKKERTVVIDFLRKHKDVLDFKRIEERYQLGRTSLFNALRTGYLGPKKIKTLKDALDDIKKDIENILK